MKTGKGTGNEGKFHKHSYKMLGFTGRTGQFLNKKDSQIKLQDFSEKVPGMVKKIHKQCDKLLS